MAAHGAPIAAGYGDGGTERRRGCAPSKGDGRRERGTIPPRPPALGPARRQTSAVPLAGLDEAQGDHPGPRGAGRG
jgi:hypothetical protein